jgi:hypothetical protein
VKKTLAKNVAENAKERTAAGTAKRAAKNLPGSFTCVHEMPPPAKKHTEPKGLANKRKRLFSENGQWARQSKCRGGKPGGLPPDQQRRIAGA